MEANPSLEAVMLRETFAGTKVEYVPVSSVFSSIMV